MCALPPLIAIQPTLETSSPWRKGAALSHLLNWGIARTRLLLLVRFRLLMESKRTSKTIHIEIVEITLEQKLICGLTK